MGRHTLTEGGSLRRLSDTFRAPWVKGPIVLSIILLAAGLTAILLLKFLKISDVRLLSDIKAFIESYGLIGVFLVTVVAGTLIPLGSPALVAAAAVFGLHPIPLTLVATAGFTIGMCVNYGLAYYLGRPYVVRRVSPERLKEFEHLWSKWGWTIYTLFGLIPLLPVELLSFVCGLLKARFDIFLALSFMPRFVVFAVLAYFGGVIGDWIGLA